MRQYADEETKGKIDLAREKGVPLANVNFKIKEKSFDGVHYKLQLREEIAKDLIERIREKVTEVDPSPETGVANTVVPYFDINFFNLYDLFLKEDGKQSSSHDTYHGSEIQINTKPTNDSPQSVATPATPLREMIRNLAAPLHQFNQEDPALNPIGIKSKSAMVIGNKSDSQPEKKSNIPDNFIDQDLKSASSSPNNKSPTHDLDSPPKDKILLEEKQTHPEKIDSDKNIRIRKSSKDGHSLTLGPHELRAHGSSDDIPRRSSLRHSFTTFETNRNSKELAKEANRPKINLPKMLVRIQSSEDVGCDNDDQEAETMSMLEKRSFVSSLRPPPTVRSGLHITVGSLGLLFAMSKNLQRKTRFESVKPFDQNLPLIKKIFGLPDVVSSILEYKNQSLSKLGIST